MPSDVNSSALLETLFDNNVLTLDQARTILDRAMRSLGPSVMATPGGFQASQIIGALQRGKFSARS